MDYNIGTMSFKDTKIYQEAFEEGRLEGERRAKLKLIPTLLKLEVTVEQVAEAFDFSVEEVREVAQSQP